MSTNACIAKRTANGWQGVIHHFDGYPSGLGKAIWNCVKHFNGNWARATEYLIDDHPAGWSSICEADFSKEPGFVEHGSHASNSPKCYCHGDRHDEPDMIYEGELEDTSCRWLYIIDQGVLEIYKVENAELTRIADASFRVEFEDDDWEMLDNHPRLITSKRVS